MISLTLVLDCFAKSSLPLEIWHLYIKVSFDIIIILLSIELSDFKEVNNHFQNNYLFQITFIYFIYFSLYNISKLGYIESILESLKENSI